MSKINISIDTKEFGEETAHTFFSGLSPSTNQKQLNERLNYLIKQCDTMHMFLIEQCDMCGDEMEYAIGDISNLLRIINKNIIWDNTLKS